MSWYSCSIEEPSLNEEALHVENILDDVDKLLRLVYDDCLKNYNRHNKTSKNKWEEEA